jgi:hypothetical protein
VPIHFLMELRVRLPVLAQKAEPQVRLRVVPAVAPPASGLNLRVEMAAQTPYLVAAVVVAAVPLDLAPHLQEPRGPRVEIRPMAELAALMEPLVVAVPLAERRARIQLVMWVVTAAKIMRAPVTVLPVAIRELRAPQAVVALEVATVVLIAQKHVTAELVAAVLNGTRLTEQVVEPAVAVGTTTIKPMMAIAAEPALPVEPMVVAAAAGLEPVMSLKPEAMARRELSLSPTRLSLSPRT